MSDVTLDELGRALVAADKAGDVESAKLLAAEYDRRSAVGEGQKTAAASSAGAAGSPTGQPSENGVPDRSSFGRLLRFAGMQVPAEIAKQGVGLAMLPGEVLRSGINKLSGDPADFGAGTKIAQNAIDSFVKPPETQAGRIGARVVGGGAAAAGMGLAGIGTVSRNVITNATGTVGSEVGAELGGNYAGDNGRVIGGVIGGVVGGSPLSIAKGRGSHNEMLADAIKGITPGDFKAAARVQADTKAIQSLLRDPNTPPIDLTVEQLFDKSTGLEDLVNAVLRSGAGDGNLQRRVMGTGVNTQSAAQSVGNPIGPRVDLDAANRDIRLASEGAIKNAGQTSPAVGKLFRDKEAVISGDEMDQLERTLAQLQGEYRGSRETAAAIQDLRNRLGTVTEKQTFPFGTKTEVVPGKGAQKWAAKQAPNNVEVTLGAAPQEVDTVVKSVEALLKDIGVGTPAMEKLLTGRVGGAVGQVKTVLDKIIATRPQGAALYKSMKERQEELTSGLVGRMAGRTGVNEARPDPKTVITGNIGGEYPQDKALAVLAGALKQRAARAKMEGDDVAGAQASRALPQAARLKYDEAVHSAFDGNANIGAGGAALADKLIGNGNPVKEANFKALMLGSREAQGMEDPKAFADGMVAMLRALRASSRNRSGNLPAIGGNEIKPSIGQIAGKTGAVATVSPAWAAVTAGRGYAERLSQIAHERQYAKLSEIFNDPNALNLIQQLGKMPLGSSRAGAILNTLLSATGTPSEGEKNVP